MNKNFFSEKTAKRLMTFGAIGFVSCIVVSIIINLTLYSKVNNSGFTNSCTGSCANLTWQIDTVHIAVVLSYISLAAIITGILMIIGVSLKANKQQPLSVQPQPYNPLAPQQSPVAVSAVVTHPKNVKHLVIRILASIAAFFISTSIVIAVLADSILNTSNKNTDQQAHTFAYIIIVAYPVVGGLSAYLTNRYLKKKLG